ncbi:uncharacterized protein LOC116413438 isoform X2 [Galleria mellonella]|uniref:Uncharacterized protein LOC116413438 isoform X2 n=1 Tax=Galleria mellonella TaxID=7137 RepID=A0A6J3C4V6_GALME|nr:uncharacterized protein LOC116413438 isoform X2 [Galleria mellonella]
MLLLILLLYATIISCDYNNTDYPDIQDIFSILKNNETQLPSDVKALDVKLNIETLDVNKFKKKMQTYEAEMSKLYNINNNTINNTEVFSNDTRRFYIPYIWSWWNAASTMAHKLKTLDMMLQVLHMAKFKINQLETSKYFNQKDTGYRIAFLYRRLRRIYRKIIDIYMTTKLKRDQGKDSNIAISGHQRAVRFHVDFLYLWWVLIRIDKRFQDQKKSASTTRATLKRKKTKY